MMNSDNFRLRSELTPEERTPFVKVYGPELTDSRLSSDEKVLLWYLRLRSSSNYSYGESDGETFMSWKRVAIELGKGESTVRKMASRLKELGLIKTESRGFGRSSDKIIARPSSIYSPDVFSEKFNSLVKGKVDGDKINILRSIDNAENDPLRSNESALIDNAENDPLRSERSVQSATPVAHRPLGSERSYIDLKEQDSVEQDTARFARGRSEISDNQTTSDKNKIIKDNVGYTSEGLKYDLNTGEVFDQVVPEIKKTRAEEDRDSALLDAARIASDAASRANRKSQEALDKSRERREREEMDGTAEARMRLKAMTKMERQTVGSRFEQWARDEYDLFFSEVRMARWSPREFSQLKMLLGFYDNDESLIRRAWSYTCEHWDELTKKLKIADAAPTIGLLLAMRNRILPLVQSRKTDRQIAERKSLSGDIGEW